MRLFFATDLHASDLCFRKFCEAADFYNCEALILGGDVSGKLLIPLTVDGDHVTYELGGQQVRVKASELDAEKKRIANMGYYAIEADPEEYATDVAAYERRLLDEAILRIHRWVEYAENRLASTPVRIYFAPGNDDELEVDAAFEGSSVFVNCEQKVVDLGGVEMASCGWSNPTPWRTPRECDEGALRARLEGAIEGVSEPERAIFNFHVPPHGTQLDVCPQIDEDFNVVTVMGNPMQIHAGSTAVREVIEARQPLASLHGHIHESRSATKLGRTWSINPGSEYGEGVLRGVIVNTKGTKVKHTFTAG
ncbi:MAG TPA: hypothetical protein VG186_01840 [Solirubrobacteraceae bacterium]|jgi:hypothetical protein|nr:hypothetical protein [Solirubrobacteraceae bacterium]